MEDDIVYTKVRVRPKNVYMYCSDNNILAMMTKHKNSILRIEPSSIECGCHGILNVVYHKIPECHCLFSEIFIDQDCINFVKKPIDESLIEYVKVVIK